MSPVACSIRAKAVNHAVAAHKTNIAKRKKMARGIFDATLAKGEGVLFFDACPVNTGEVPDGKPLKPDAEYHTHTCRASAAEYHTHTCRA